MDVLTLPAAVRSATPAARPVTIVRGSLLALDLGTSTGWALRTADDYTSSGTVLLKHSRYDGGGMRFLRFRRWLEDLDQDAGPIEAIYFEEVRRHAGTDPVNASLDGLYLYINGILPSTGWNTMKIGTTIYSRANCFSSTGSGRTYWVWPGTQSNPFSAVGSNTTVTFA